MATPIHLVQPPTPLQGSIPLGPWVNNGYVDAKIVLNIPTADYEKAGNEVDFHVSVSPDGIQPYRIVCGATWRNPNGGQILGRHGVIDPAPVISCGIGAYPGWSIRVEFVIPNAMTVGATIDVT